MTRVAIINLLAWVWWSGLFIMLVAVIAAGRPPRTGSDEID